LDSLAANPYNSPVNVPSDVQTVVQELVRSPDNICFVCGPNNPHGLRVHFEERDGVVRGCFEPGDWHQGWQGVIHGGVLASLLDEAMAYTLFFRGFQGVTARMEVRFRAPARAHERLEVQARTVKDGSRVADMVAEVRREGAVLAVASARFMKLGPITPETIAGETRR
jgi:acyl-coenzyme A thioesterase PaaI-like protein